MAVALLLALIMKRVLWQKVKPFIPDFSSNSFPSKPEYSSGTSTRYVRSSLLFWTVLIAKPPLLDGNITKAISLASSLFNKTSSYGRYSSNIRYFFLHFFIFSSTIFLAFILASCENISYVNIVFATLQALKNWVFSSWPES